MNGDLEFEPNGGYVVVVLSNFDSPAETQVATFILDRLPTSTPAGASAARSAPMPARMRRSSRENRFPMILFSHGFGHKVDPFNPSASAGNRDGFLDSPESIAYRGRGALYGSLGPPPLPYRERWKARLLRRRPASPTADVALLSAGDPGGGHPSAR